MLKAIYFRANACILTIEKQKYKKNYRLGQFALRFLLMTAFQAYF